MYDKVIVIRLGELYLKGKNRSFFTGRLIQNIKKALEGIKCQTHFSRARYTVSDYAPHDEEVIINRLSNVFGIYSLSPAYVCNDSFDSIRNLAAAVAPDAGTFRVNAHRSKKSYPLNSMEICAALGAELLSAKPQLKVDLHNPDFAVNVDVREDGTAFVFLQTILGAGGMPAGTAGKGLLLLSGGIDSPVAGYMMAKRGLCLDALHFHSYPYTGEQALEKVKNLAKKLQLYSGAINFLSVKLTRLQEEINRNAASPYMITLLRRAMMRVANTVADMRGCGCIVNGESLGQVASQTLESIIVSNSVAALPVMRPLIGFDKEEIISIARKIGTFDISVLPFEDCCTVFLPKNPATKPTVNRAVAEEQKIKDYDALIRDAVDNIEIIPLIT